jgi:signal transduction histidine kinase
MFITLVNVVTCVFIIGLVLIKNPHSRLVHLFSLFIGEIALWAVFYYAWMRSTHPDLAEFLVRTAMIFIAVVPASFMHFVGELTCRPFPRWVYVVNYTISLFFASQVYSPAFARYGAGSFLIFPVWPIAGPLFYLHLLHFSINFLGGTVIMWRVMQVETGVLKTRIAAVCWGNLLGVVTGSTNFLPWMRADVPMLGYMPPLFTWCVWLFVLVYGWAIIRHQLMDIEVVIKRTLVFAGLVGSVAVMVSLVAFVSQDVLVRFVAIPKWLSNVLAATVIAAVYGPVRNWLVDVTDRYLFQKKYDYKELLRRFTNEALTIVDLKQLVQRTVDRLTETVKLECCTLLLLNRQTRRYERVASCGTAAPAVALDEQEPFVTFLHRTQEPIGTEGELGRVRFPETVRDRLRQLNARLCLPLQIHDELIGVLCLGKKKSDEPFSKDDLDVLHPLSRTLSIAVSNAQLFDDLAKTQAEAAQREKLAVIGTLSAGINHEIRNPLGIIKAQCETFVLDWQDGLLKGQPWQAILDRCLAIMQGAIYHIDRATAITRKLSSFAKPIREVSIQPVSVAREVDEVLTLVGHDLALDKIEVRREMQPNLPPIMADRGQIEEILFNLIRNAGQAIEPPGTIWVRAYSKGETQVRIEIADTGCGIQADTLEKIFDPFFTTKEPGQGTGLGLFIVRQIIERNKGRISVESAVGKGTTFFLDFPKGEEEARAHAGSAPLVRLG